MTVKDDGARFVHEGVTVADHAVHHVDVPAARQLRAGIEGLVETFELKREVPAHRHVGPCPNSSAPYGKTRSPTGPGRTWCSGWLPRRKPPRPFARHLGIGLELAERVEPRATDDEFVVHQRRDLVAAKADVEQRDNLLGSELHRTGPVVQREADDMAAAARHQPEAVVMPTHLELAQRLRQLHVDQA